MSSGRGIYVVKTPCRVLACGRFRAFAIWTDDAIGWSALCSPVFGATDGAQDGSVDGGDVRSVEGAVDDAGNGRTDNSVGGAIDDDVAKNDCKDRAVFAVVTDVVADVFT